MNKQLPPFFIITGSCVRSQTFTPKYTSTETWVRYSDFVDYFPVALDECAEDKVALSEENARLKAEVQRDTEIHRRNTAMWKDDCEKYREEISKLNAEIERIKSYTFTHKELDSMKAETELLHGKFKRDIYNEALADNANLKSEVERLRKAGDEVIHEWSSGHGTDVENFTKAMWIWTVAKGEKPTV